MNSNYSRDQIKTNKHRSHQIKKQKTKNQKIKK